MNTVRKILFAMLLLPISAQAAAPGVQVETLARSSKSWDGESFSYPQGIAELSVARIEMADGAVLPWHCHPVPLAGVVTRGSLTVSKPNGQEVTFHAGEGVVEVSRQWHQGRATGEVEIIVVYAGAEGQPLGFGQDAEAELAEQCR